MGLYKFGEKKIDLDDQQKICSTYFLLKYNPDEGKTTMHPHDTMPHPMISIN